MAISPLEEPENWPIMISVRFYSGHASHQRQLRQIGQKGTGHGETKIGTCFLDQFMRTEPKKLTMPIFDSTFEPSKTSATSAFVSRIFMIYSTWYSHDHSHGGLPWSNPTGGEQRTPRPASRMDAAGASGWLGTCSWPLLELAMLKLIDFSILGWRYVGPRWSQPCFLGQSTFCILLFAPKERNRSAPCCGAFRVAAWRPPRRSCWTSWPFGPIETITTMLWPLCWEHGRKRSEMASKEDEIWQTMATFVFNVFYRKNDVFTVLMRFDISVASRCSSAMFFNVFLTQVHGHGNLLRRWRTGKRSKQWCWHSKSEFLESAHSESALFRTTFLSTFCNAFHDSLSGLLISWQQSRPKKLIRNWKSILSESSSQPTIAWFWYFDAPFLGALIDERSCRVEGKKTHLVSGCVVQPPPRHCQKEGPFAGAGIKGAKRVRRPYADST